MTIPASLQPKLIDFETLLETIDIESMALECGLFQRCPRKLNARDLVLSFLRNNLDMSKASRNIAINFGLQANCQVSSQAIRDRVQEPFVKLLESVLFTALIHRSQIKAELAAPKGLFKHFLRVLIQDSTTLPLDKSLFDAFPGSKNKYGEYATAKIQAIFNCLNEEFCDFKLTSFSENDQSAAEDILETAQPGDLVIRDLGYFVLSVFKKMIAQGIYFLSRYRHDVVILDTDGETRIDLLKLLKGKSSLDIFVYVGAEIKVPVRLVAQRVSDEVANERKEQAKADRDKRLNHDEEYFELLHWDIFITNVPHTIWTPEEACEANGVRWRIEIVFKSWKSHLKITNIHKSNEDYVKALIYAALIFITLFQTNVYARINNCPDDQFHNKISLIKLTEFIKERGYILLALCCFVWVRPSCPECHSEGIYFDAKTILLDNKEIPMGIF